MRQEPPRLGRFAIDHAFEALLARANHALEGIEQELVTERPAPSHRMLVICYPPRSGSTMLAQLLARTQAFNYVTNFQARFWEAPYLAGLIEKKIGIREMPFPEVIRSAYGVTMAPHEPHEFGFFWNRWLVFAGETHRVAPTLMPEEKTEGLRRELLALRSLYEKPFFVKSDLVGLNVEYFYRLMPDVVFVVLRRDPLFIAQSIYRARLQLYASSEVYWSTRPSNEAHRYVGSPEDQIVLQINGIYNDIYNGLRQTGAPYIEVQYETLCRQPRKEVGRLLEFAGAETWSLAQIPEQLPVSERHELPREVIRRIVQAMSRHG
ncbi:MAG: hypothetical protein D6746_15230 [Bacteroidetes bacterium]|nr:MAG: hypothetical protein D6746_15230 [Bacteroidota bacterium]